jgi:hypothetical protein
VSKRLRMRQDETGLKITEDFVLSHNGAGEVLNTYIRQKPPLELWRRHGLPETLYEAGRRYGRLWREVVGERSPAHSDTTRIIVDGGASAPDHLPRGAAWAESEMEDAQKAIRNPEVASMLNRLCGQEDWPAGDKRRFKRQCKHGLAALVELWRRR